MEPDLPPLALQLAASPMHMAILGDAQFPFRALGLVHMAQRVIADPGRYRRRMRRF
jgi:hypothetical protein